MSMKHSNDTTGNRSRVLPVCSAVPQPLRHRVPPPKHVGVNVLIHWCFRCILLVLYLPYENARSKLQNTLPHVFVGDEVYPLTTYLIKTYSRRTLDTSKATFNYRVSRVRRVVDCAFGIWGSKVNDTGQSHWHKSILRRGNCEVLRFTAQYYHRLRRFAWIFIKLLRHPGCKWRYSVKKKFQKT
jgi:hypothetical protein